MKTIPEEALHLFQAQGYAVVSTVDSKGSVHNSCKGIVKINKQGRLYLLDLYQGKTYANLRKNNHISVAVVDEHRFKGYCLKGKAEIILSNEFDADTIRAWEAKINSRITQRLLRNIREEKGHPRHPEALLPKPEYMIAVDIEEIVDLTPLHLKI